MLKTITITRKQDKYLTKKYGLHYPRYLTNYQILKELRKHENRF